MDIWIYGYTLSKHAKKNTINYTEQRCAVLLQLIS